MTKPKPKVKTVNISSLVPPFRRGDWVAAVSMSSVQYIPFDPEKDVFRRFVVQLTEDAVYEDNCETGWRLFDVDSSHFRKASVHDLQVEEVRISKLISHLKEARDVLREFRKGWLSSEMT